MIINEFSRIIIYIIVIIVVALCIIIIYRYRKKGHVPHALKGEKKKKKNHLFSFVFVPTRISFYIFEFVSTHTHARANTFVRRRSVMYRGCVHTVLIVDAVSSPSPRTHTRRRLLCRRG